MSRLTPVDLKFYALIGISRLQDMFFKKLQDSNYTDEKAREYWEYYSKLWEDLHNEKVGE